MRTARWLTVVLLISSAAAASPKAADVPFSSFARLDQKLTDLQEQLRALEGSLEREEKDLAHPRRWRAPAKKLRGDIRYIEHTAHGLRLHYRHSHWGRLAFLALEKKSQRMAHAADALLRARTPAAARQARDALSRQLVPLIVQFQAITTNYSTLHCDPGQAACCEPKKREAAEKIPEHECKWVCVKERRACRNGIIGPKAR